MFLPRALNGQPYVREKSGMEFYQVFSNLAAGSIAEDLRILALILELESYLFVLGSHTFKQALLFMRSHEDMNNPKDLPEDLATQLVELLWVQPKYMGALRATVPPHA